MNFSDRPFQFDVEVVPIRVQMCKAINVPGELRSLGEENISLFMRRRY